MKTQTKAELLIRIAALEELIKELAEPDECMFNTQGGCVIHNYLYCPHQRAKMEFPELFEEEQP